MTEMNDVVKDLKEQNKELTELCEGIRADYEKVKQVLMDSYLKAVRNNWLKNARDYYESSLAMERWNTVREIVSKVDLLEEAVSYAEENM